MVMENDMLWKCDIEICHQKVRIIRGFVSLFQKLIYILILSLIDNISLSDSLLNKLKDINITSSLKKAIDISNSEIN
ncbi:hypothetical protein PNEG_04337 [Pneumocystis murina B123]|uniref:Uncharacterized protein n=1 Tax=Pneumocystis murina (strain B123) TaxID=1069680 RepID=A0A0W4ZWV4_PNEMU|nr:hypothetical protein PNEG_04337 [Pneumocystis murina B123]KTW32852.1 hypothetical protein PNEG_04337 [Pneumocystis murina B123]